MEEATASAAAKENKLEEINTAEFATPTANEIELVAWITDHTDRWRDNRNQNYLKLWDEYERIFRGQWDSSDATRSTERSRLMSPATQQAVETRHAEIVEAVFGSGDFFDIEDDVVDANGSPLDIEQIKKRLSEDFKQDKVRKAIEQIILLSEIYGTGIGEIIVKEAVKVVPATQAIPGMA
jgi:hypothetical protein